MLKATATTVTIMVMFSSVRVSGVAVATSSAINLKQQPVVDLR